MSTPDLTTWAQTHLTSLYTLPVGDANVDAFTSAFDTAFSPNVSVSTNGESVSRDEVREKISRRRGAMVGADVKWENVICVPKNADSPDEAGIVAGFYVVTRSLKFHIRAAPAQTQMFVTVQATIEQDTSVTDPSGDNRRITQLIETVLDKPVPVQFVKPRFVPTDGAQTAQGSLHDMD